MGGKGGSSQLRGRGAEAAAAANKHRTFGSLC